MISTLAARVRAQADAARQRERRTQVLYAMSRDLAAARTVEEVAAAASRHVSEVFGGRAAVLVPGPTGVARGRERGPRQGRAPRGRRGPVGLRPRADGRARHRHAARLDRGLGSRPGIAVHPRGGGRQPGPHAAPPPDRPARPAGGPRATGGLRPRAGAAGRRGAAGSCRGRGGAAAQHAPELRLARPADAARHDHRRRQQPAPGRLARGRLETGAAGGRSTRRRCASTAS